MVRQGAPPSLTSGPGESGKLPPAGLGTEPWPKTISVYIRTVSECLITTFKQFLAM